MNRRTRAGAISAVAALTLLVLSTALAAGEKVVTYGADLTPLQKQELAQIFGVEATAPSTTITTADMIMSLQGTGLPVAPTDKSISSSVITCLNKGDGLDVRTQNITRITAPLYANAMVTAGVGDGNVLIAAPQSNPVTGETALAGVLKAFPQCQGGKAPEQARINLAYEQLARTVALAGPSGDLTKASAVVLQATQPVITGQAKDDAAISAALDSAAGAQGLQVPPNQRGDLVVFLKKLGGLDYGTYAKGYQVQQASPNQVKVIPSGAGAPGGAAVPTANPAGTARAAAPTAANAPNVNAAPARFDGKVTNTGNRLTVETDGQGRNVTPAANLVVTRDGKSAALGDLKKNDKVSVTTGPDGNAQRIDATSADGSPAWLKWLLPLLVLLAIVGLALWFLGKRRKDNFIIEPKR